jgi:hypothetical protein
MENLFSLGALYKFVVVCTDLPFIHWVNYWKEIGFIN